MQTSTTTFWSLKRPAAYVHANPVGTLLDLGRVTQTLLILVIMYLVSFLTLRVDVDVLNSECLACQKGF